MNQATTNESRYDAGPVTSAKKSVYFSAVEEHGDVVPHADEVRPLEHVEVRKAYDERQKDGKEGEEEEQDHVGSHHQVADLVLLHQMPRPLPFRHILSGDYFLFFSHYLSPSESQM